MFSSPHLWDYVERIQIDGEPISHEQLVKLVEEVKPAVKKVPKLTTFEITTAIAFLAFAKNNVDVAVIEVGLGGRLDATNVVMPKVSVITSLSYDHRPETHLWRSQEKAGIIKRRTPVSRLQVPEALDVLSAGQTEKLPAYSGGKDVKFERLNSS
jgi:dihydrofolate synthase/folylpolyglutamate synthase